MFLPKGDNTDSCENFQLEYHNIFQNRVFRPWLTPISRVFLKGSKIKVYRFLKKVSVYLLGSRRHGDSSKAFIYSLSNNNGSGYAVFNPVKLNVKSDGQSKAVYRCHSHGPTFGFGYDIRIWDKTLQVNGIFWLIVTEAIPFPRVFFIWF